MSLLAKLIAAFAVAAVLVAAIVTSFVLVGANATSTSRPTAAIATADTGAATTAGTTASTTAIAGMASKSPAAAGAPTISTEAGPAEGYVEVDFKVLYRSVAQLKQAADVVVRGEVTAVSYLDRENAPTTKVTLKVAKCLKGDVKAGDEITILEPGGIVSRASTVGDKFGSPTKEDYDTKVKMLMDGAPLTEVGDRCLYFLGVDDLHLAPGVSYYPLGFFQGRFVIHDGVAERFVPASPGEMGSEYTSLAMDEAAIDDTISSAGVE
jgi:hypothetical protein